MVQMLSTNHNLSDARVYTAGPTSGGTPQTHCLNTAPGAGPTGAAVISGARTESVRLNRGGRCLTRCGRSLKTKNKHGGRRADRCLRRGLFHVKRGRAAFCEMTIELPASVECALCDSGT